MLKLENVDVVYAHTIQALKRVSLEVEEGRIVALLGANGAGKSTILKAISGLLGTEGGEISHGTIEFRRSMIGGMKPEDVVRLGLVHVMEGSIVFPHLSTEENLMVGAHCRNDRDDIKKDLERVYDYFPLLKKLRHRTSGYLSGGERQMLVIGRGLMARPKTMLLDEPSLGLAPSLVQDISNIIRRINVAEKTSILLVEQNAGVALSIADYVYVIENGRVVLEGSAQDLKDSSNVKESYLGVSDAGVPKSYKEVKYYRTRKKWAL
jgi:branched-chain amino acid transport system ATP-binding protein